MTATTPAPDAPSTEAESAQAHGMTLSSLLADALKTKNSQKKWYERDNKSNHDQRPGRPPHGTRRSMGKR